MVPPPRRRKGQRNKDLIVVDVIAKDWALLCDGTFARITGPPDLLVVKLIDQLSEKDHRQARRRRVQLGVE